MLVLSRRENERLLFPDLGISVEVVKLTRARAALGIVAPKNIRIMRHELATNEWVGCDFDRSQSGPTEHDPLLRSMPESIELGIDAAMERLSIAQAELANGRIEQAMDAMSRAITDLDRLRDRSAKLDANEPWSVSEGVAETSASYCDSSAASESRCENTTVSNARLLFFDAAAGSLTVQLQQLDSDVQLVSDPTAALDELSRYAKPDFVLLWYGEQVETMNDPWIQRCCTHRQIPLAIADR